MVLGFMARYICLPDYEEKYQKVYSIEEVRQYNEKQGGHVALRAMELLKLLEKNRYFQQECKKFRDYFNLPPEGITFEEYAQMMSDLTVYYQAKADGVDLVESPRLVCFRQYDAYFHNLLKGYECPVFVEENLLPLFLSNLTDNPQSFTDKRINCYPVRSGQHAYSPFLVLSIHSAKVTKNALKRFIDLNWNDIAEQMKLLPQELDTSVSKPYARIYQLRNEGKKFEAVADECGYDYDAWTAKTAYCRVNKKINSLFRPKKGVS